MKLVEIVGDEPLIFTMLKKLKMAKKDIYIFFHSANPPRLADGELIDMIQMPDIEPDGSPSMNSRYVVRYRPKPTERVIAMPGFITQKELEAMKLRKSTADGSMWNLSSHEPQPDDEE